MSFFRPVPCAIRLIACLLAACSNFIVVVVVVVVVVADDVVLLFLLLPQTIIGPSHFGIEVGLLEKRFGFIATLVVPSPDTHLHHHRHLLQPQTRYSA